MASNKGKRYRPDTLLSILGRDPEANHGIVNPPVYHASTILYPNVAALRAARPDYGKTFYGRHGTPTTFALQETAAEIEGGYRSFVFASGKAAILAALLAFVESGDHMLVTDSAYGPTRHLAKGLMRRMGIETTFYEPLVGGGIADLMRPNTKLVFTESPGSLTFEVQDLPAIAAAAHAAGAKVVTDNTWASPYFCDPFRLGVDLSIQAGTKYIVGHSDAMLGLLTATEDTFEATKRVFEDMGSVPGPDDCYLALRGFRTLAVRLRQHQETGLALARWLEQRSEVSRVLHPGLPSDPGHALWQRDFTGASGLFGVVLHPTREEAVAALLDGLELFGLGYSWGGYESLAIPTYPHLLRDVGRWDPSYPCLRIHAGLEDPADLIVDLEKGFERLNAVA